MLCPGQWRRIAPERARSAHDRFIIACIGMAEQPHLINGLALYLADNVELLHEPQVIDGIWLVKAPGFKGTEIACLIIGETVPLNRKTIDLDPLHDLILDKA